MKELQSWIKEHGVTPASHTLQFSSDEKQVKITQLPNRWWEDLQISHGSLEFANRFIRKMTLQQVSDRKTWQQFSREDLLELSSSVPSGQDVAGLMNADPLHTSGLFWDRVVGHPLSNGLPVGKWGAAHRRMCDKCAGVGGSDEEFLEAVKNSGSEFRSFFSEECYGGRLMAYLRYGYLPHVHTTIPEYHKETSPGVVRIKGFKAAWQKDRNKPGLFVKGDSKHVSPLVGVEKAMDVYRLRHLPPGSYAKCRVCFNGKFRINTYISDWKLRYVDFDMIVSEARPNEYIGKVDISGFFHGLPNHPDIVKYYSIKDPFTGEIIAYANLPFGIKTAPAFASVISGEMRLYMLYNLRSKDLHTGTRIYTYIDDYVVWNVLQNTVNDGVREVVSVITEMGLQVADPKTEWGEQERVVLGRIVNTVRCIIGMKPDHVQCATEFLSTLIEKNMLALEVLQSLAGLLSYLSTAFLGSRPYLRSMWNYLKRYKNSTRRCVSMNERETQDAMYWLRNFIGRRSITANWINVNVAEVEVLSTDASGDVGGGAFSSLGLYSCVWDEKFITESVPYKELYTSVQALYIHREHFRNKVIFLFTDSITNVFAFASGSSTSNNCHNLLRIASSIMVSYNFQILVMWLPREYNVVSDQLSKGALDGMCLIQNNCVLQSIHNTYHF